MSAAVAQRERRTTYGSFLPRERKPELRLVLRPFALPFGSGVGSANVLERARIVAKQMVGRGKFVHVGAQEYYISGEAGVLVGATLNRLLEDDFTGMVVFRGQYGEGYHYIAQVRDGVVETRSEELVHGDQELVRKLVGQGEVRYFAEVEGAFPRGEEGTLVPLSKKGVRTRRALVEFSARGLPHLAQAYVLGGALLLAGGGAFALDVYQSRLAEIARLEAEAAAARAAAEELLVAKSDLVGPAIAAWLESDWRLYRGMGLGERVLEARESGITQSFNWRAKRWGDVDALAAVAARFEHEFLDGGGMEPYRVVEYRGGFQGAEKHLCIDLEDWLRDASAAAAQWGFAMETTTVNLGAHCREAFVRFATAPSNRSGIAALASLFAGVPTAGVAISETYGDLGVAEAGWEMTLQVFGSES